jgi:hypothetical protein
MTDTTNTPPIWFWILTVILLLWGMMGMYVYYDFVTSTPESMAKYIEAGTYSQAYADYLLAEPTWSAAVFALAVTSGFLGAVSLLLRRSWAAPLYMLSLLFISISLGKMFLLDKAHTMMSGGQVGMEGIVFLLGVLAVWVSRTANNKDWLT